MNTKDYDRFTDSLFVFNDTEDLNGNQFKYRVKRTQTKKLVNIIAYCLMPNHFHLLLEQLDDDGITHFMKKLTTSYSMYFNRKYSRTGALVQGTFKRSRIRTNPQLLEICRYIHSNPLKILSDRSRQQLADYPWSSLPDYLGNPKALPIISNTKIILDQFKTPETCRRFFLDDN